ncbi:hypothetical protein [Novosphingobium soli]|uniref:DUF2336 domain-containing protein n=1 Tax=Novosphingobium soli TaxID=574956 RepID=A0ABV6CT44_9SPHN
MIEEAVHKAGPEGVEAALREELARADAVAGTALPILRYLVSLEDDCLFGEDVLARVRGMIADLAAEVLHALAGEARPCGHVGGDVDVLTRAFVDDAALLSHVHALAVEWQLTERLQLRLGLDPVFSPLLKEGMASVDPAVRHLASAFLAAQGRWCQVQRRMSLPLRDLPEAVREGVFAILRKLVGRDGDLADRLDRLHAAEGPSGLEPSREALAARLVTALAAAGAALSLPHAGLALFLSAVAGGCGATRDAVIGATHERQAARFALMLRAVGLPSASITRALLALHPAGVPLPPLDPLQPEQARALLAAAPVLAPAAPVPAHT